MKKDEEKEQFARSISVEDLVMVAKEKHEEEAKNQKKLIKKSYF